MKPGFCYVAERTEPALAVRQMIASLERSGVVLSNPETGRVTELAHDGEQVDTSEARLLQAAAARPELSFQFWLSSDTDVSCSFRQIAPGLVRHGYSLDGLDADERDRLMRWAISYFREAAARETAALLVVDPPGVTAELDWDRVVSQAVALPTVLPAIIGLPASWMSRLNVSVRHSRERIGSVELLTVESSSDDRILKDL